MIKGIKNWKNKNYYYVQTNNPTEESLRKKGVKYWLESCGNTSAVNIIAGMDYNVDIKCPGGYLLPADEALGDFFNDPSNYKEFEKIRKDVDPKKLMGNEIPQYYPYAVKQVFNVNAEFVFIKDFDKIAEHIQEGKGVQLCLKKPGHFIACVAYDDVKKEIIINDSWPGRFADKNGFNKRLTQTEYDKNVNSFAVIFY
jgi:hypothetical protein